MNIFVHALIHNIGKLIEEAWENRKNNKRKN